MTEPHGFKPIRAVLALELPFGVRFDEPRVEWRRLFAEFFGTLMLVVVAAGAPVVNAVSGGGVSPTARVVAPGLVVMALIYATGAVGGAHLNPAVSVCFAVRGNFPWIRVPGYVLMQLLGAASGAKNIGTNAALAVGAYVAMAGMWAAPIAGASMNPARSFGPALIGGHWRSAWVYVVGPMAGGLLAVVVAWLLRGPPSSAGDRAAQGDLEFVSDPDAGCTHRSASGCAASIDLPSAPGQLVAPVEQGGSPLS